jgi:hypothetical protein
VLGLSATTKGEKDLYREVLGELLFGDRKYFQAPFPFSLDPLRQRGPDALLCEDVPEMNSAKLVEVRRYFGGSFKERQIHVASDLFGVYGDAWPKRLSFGTLDSATFEISLGEGRSKRRRRITVGKDYAKFDRDDDDADIIELWLRKRRFMPGDTENTIAAPSTALVASAAADPAENDRAAGMGAAAE